MGTSGMRRRGVTQDPATTALSVLHALLSAGVLLAAGFFVLSRVTHLANPEREAYDTLIKTFAWLPLLCGVVARLLAGRIARVCWPIVATGAALIGLIAGANRDSLTVLLITPFAIFLAPIASLAGVGIGELLPHCRRLRSELNVVWRG